MHMQLPHASNSHPWPPQHGKGDLTRSGPRQKKYHHKTRDGCLTCKRRRVKCDEKRPRCQSCIRKDLRCNYTPVARPENGMVIIQYCPPTAPPSPPHFDLARLDFFMGNTLAWLSLVGAPQGSFTEKVISHTARTQIEDFCKTVTVYHAYQQPEYCEMVSIFGERHRSALTKGDPGTNHYSRMVSAMSQVARRLPPYLVLAGMLLFYAYERLETAVTGQSPPDQHRIHYDAAMKLFQASSKSEQEIITPLFQLHWEMEAFWQKHEGSVDVSLPDEFENCAHAERCIESVLQSSRVSQSLEQWAQTLSRYYEKVRGCNWEESKRVLTILSEAQMMVSTYQLARPDHEVST